MKTLLKSILDFFIPKSVDEQEADYIKRNGYPDEDVVFADRQGRVSKLIGTNSFLKQIELHKKYFNATKKDYRR